MGGNVYDLCLDANESEPVVSGDRVAIPTAPDPVPAAVYRVTRGGSCRPGTS